jgi:superfamily II DNA or RNA helicase
MKRNIERLNYHQDQAVEAWVQNNYVGTWMLFPGAGKTIASLKAAYRLLEDGKINKGDTIVFLAETIVREKTLFEDEIPKFKSLFDKDPVADFNIQFRCYQAMPVEEFNNFENIGLLVADEIQDGLSAKYSENIINNKCKHVVALTGAMSLDQHVYPQDIQDNADLLTIYQTDAETKRGEITEFISKGQLLSMYIPVVYKVETKQAIEEGMIAKYQTWIINHHLDTQDRSIKIWKSYDTLGTEQEYYLKKDNFRKDFRKPKYLKMAIGRELTTFLYNLKSKVATTKALLSTLSGKTLIFGERLDILENICPVVRSDNALELIEKFNSGEEPVIASSKMLKQGITLEGVQNIIFFSYSSKWHNMEQRRARIRWVEGVANLYFIVTQGTLEEKWFDKLKKEKGMRGELIQEHDLNIVGHYDSRVLLSQN